MESGMADEQKQDVQPSGGNSSASRDKQSMTGDPGRTPGKADGDEETVEESLRQKEKGKA
jgi:hypothetical protein